MDPGDRVNILLVDDQPAKLMSYEVILHDLGENLLKATSGREALEYLLKTEVAIVLVDVCMPDLDGFQLAAMIRDHPRFQKTAIIFISAVLLSDMDRLRGYEMGAVDYVPVPVIPEVLRAKVKIFAELYRKTRQLERLNAELENRVSERTAELAATAARLTESEQRRSLALLAGQMGSWDWDLVNGDCLWDEGQYRIFGVDPATFDVTIENIQRLLHDSQKLKDALDRLMSERKPQQTEFRIRRPDGAIRWCLGTASPSMDASGRVVRVSGVTVDITERKESEERQALLAREVDHRAKNALAIVQSIVRLTRADSIPTYVASVEGRITALSRAHTVLSHSRWQGADLTGLVEEELAPYRSERGDRITMTGPPVSLQPSSAQTLTLALHELATNAVKYGALSSAAGRLKVSWELKTSTLTLRWEESGGPRARKPAKLGFGTRIIVASIEGQLGGQAKFLWGESGLNCVLTIPRGEKIGQPTLAMAEKGLDDKAHLTPADRLVVNGNQVMVVEDEALVAMVVTDALTELGYEVIGPFGRPPDALAAIRNGSVNAAVLDINLAGSLIYPVADELAARGIPFIFVTGYGIESIEKRFAHVPVLAKPIERETLQRIFIAGSAVAIRPPDEARAATA
jgi:two-component sensor histidine kinase/DNA-binding response OmpR family regulator